MHVPTLPNFSFENLIENVRDANCVYGPHTFELNCPIVEVIGVGWLTEAVLVSWDYMNGKAPWNNQYNRVIYNPEYGPPNLDPHNCSCLKKQ